jgi:hypothetical protein
MPRLTKGGLASAAGLALLIVAGCAPGTRAGSTTTGASALAGERPATKLEPAASRPIDDDLSAGEIRALVIEADRFVGAHLTELYRQTGGKDVIGHCLSGRRAERLAKVSDLQAALGKYFTGPALSCHQLSCFGETFGEWVGYCLGDSGGTEFWPDARSEVIIVERSRDRVVAEVSEPGVNVPEGETEPPYNGFDTKSRYTFVRTPAAGWVIFERVPNHTFPKCPWDGAPVVFR